METNFYQLHFFAEHIVRSAGELIKQALTNNLEITTKSHAHDFVTNVDKMVENYLVNQVKNNYPSHHIISEEGYGDSVSELRGIVWGIDPIDGTANLVYQQKNFAISIGIYQDGIGQLAYIYDVMADKFYMAMKGQGAYENGLKIAQRHDRQLADSLLYTRFNYIAENRYGIRQLITESRGLGYMSCASLGFVELGKGTIDGMIGKGNMKFWDIAAGKLFAEENGVIFQGVTGEDYQICQEMDIVGAGKKLANIISQQLLAEA